MVRQQFGRTMSGEPRTRDVKHSESMEDYVSLAPAQSVSPDSRLLDATMFYCCRLLQYLCIIWRARTRNVAHAAGACEPGLWLPEPS